METLLKKMGKRQRIIAPWNSAGFTFAFGAMAELFEFLSPPQHFLARARPGALRAGAWRTGAFRAGALRAMALGARPLRAGALSAKASKAWASRVSTVH